jgi:hypothetical protein
MRAGIHSFADGSKEVAKRVAYLAVGVSMDSPTKRRKTKFTKKLFGGVYPAIRMYAVMLCWVTIGT